MQPTTTTQPPRPPDEVNHPDRAPWVEASAGAVAMTPLVVGYAPFALIVGVAVARSSDWVAAWTGTLTIYGGSAQLTLLELLAGGAAAWAAAGAAALINVRLLVFSLALVPLFATARLPVRLLAAAFVVEPTWLVALQRGEAPGTLSARRWHYAGASLVLTVGWLLFVTAGLAIGQLSSPGLAMVGPLCLTAVVIPHRRLPGGAVAVVAAGSVALVGAGASLPAGLIPPIAMAAAAAAGLAATRGGS